MRKALILTVATALLMAMGSASASAQSPFMEDFEDGDVAGWVMTDPVNGRIEAVATPVSPSGGNYVGKVTFDASCYGPSYAFDPATPDHISWYFRADGDTGHASGLGFSIMSNTGGEWMAHVSYHLGALRIYQSGSGDVQITTASTGTWYLIELKNIDWDSDTFDIWIDGVEKVVGASFYTHVDDVSYVINYACPWASGPTYVDDITFGFAPVGGIVELRREGAAASARESDSAAPPYAALAGAATAVVALTAGAWYARRRWLG